MCQLILTISNLNSWPLVPSLCRILVNSGNRRDLPWGNHFANKSRIICVFLSYKPGAPCTSPRSRWLPASSWAPEPMLNWNPAAPAAAFSPPWFSFPAVVPTGGPFWKAYWTFWIPLTSPKADFVSFSLTFPTLQPFLFPCSSISYTLFYHPLFPLYPLTFNS